MAPLTTPGSATLIERILDIARWAPSGDNTQPWRFQISDESSFVIHGYDTRDHCVYDLDGHGSQIALGALLENIAIAASEEGFRVKYTRRKDMPVTKPTYEARLLSAPDAGIDPLLSHIIQRCVQRRPLSTTPLASDQKKALKASVGDGYSVIWFESFSERLQMARLMFNNAKIRLTIPEAYQVHRTNIEWNARFSDDRVPDQALGIDPLTLKLMRWVMANWSRVDMFNTYFAGHWFPRVELDLLPGIFCAAHFMIVAHEPLLDTDSYIDGGRAMQKFWLTATSLGLHLQPEMTPLIFSRYVREGQKFTSRPDAIELARVLEQRLGAIVEEKNMDSIVFAGRIGQGKPPRARSRRRPLNELIIKNSPVDG
ncbi:MAG TPA: molybdopterin biosynthesis protein MoeY [Gammaproteobacteria bacterium]|nr:molybdopterin biosynthesis protein MoeY [Gammaproteobacteria bacterium]